MVRPEFTPEFCAALANLLNSVSGMESARVLLPGYDALRAAMAAFEEEMKATRERANPPSSTTSHAAGDMAASQH